MKFKSDVSNEKALRSISKSNYEVFKQTITEEDIKNKFEENFRLNDEFAKVNHQLEQLTSEKKSVETLIARLRNNLKAIPDNSGNKVRNNFVLRLNKFEDDLDRLGRQITILRDQIDGIKNQLEALQWVRFLLPIYIFLITVWAF